MVISNYRLVPPEYAIVPITMLLHLAKLVDTILTLEGQSAVLDAKRAHLLGDLVTATELFVRGAKL